MVVVAAQAATIVVTWPLWQARVDPPSLPLSPAFALSFAFGPWLLASLGLALVRPALGCALHAVLLALAMLADQTREQPQFVSLAVLLFASLPHRGAREVGLLHLAALWSWSGIGKLTSERFLTVGGAWLLDGASLDAIGEAPVAGLALAVALGTVEVTLGVLLLWPRTRRRAASFGVALHVGALLFLAFGRGWNAAVWPWNVALAVAAWYLPAKTTCGVRAILGRSATVRITAVAFVLLPLGFHLGVVDAPFAQQVYTMNGCRVLVLRADGRTEVVGELPAFGVLLPPVPRIARAWFGATGSAGDRMILTDDRPVARLSGGDETVLTWSEARTHP
jgi:hypothetical protein